MATIREVADMAGVSIATVSRTLSKPDVVTAETRKRILSVVDQLGYTPNSTAQSLRMARSGKILVSVPDISNPFFSNIIRAAEDMARSAGYAVVLGDTRHEPEREDQYAQMLGRREVDGLIFLGHRLPDTLIDLVNTRGASAPIVNGCEYSLDLPVSSVHIDNRKAAAAGMTYLYSLGHERIGIITGPMASPLSQDRLQGALAVSRARGVQDGLKVVMGDFSVDSGELEARHLLAGSCPPTAIFSFSDEMAIGVLAAIRARGLRCPEDVSVLGFDDIRFAKFLHPTLSTVAQPAMDIGRETVRLLLNILDGRVENCITMTLAHQLVVRESTRLRRT